MRAGATHLGCLIACLAVTGCSSHAYYNEAMRYMEQTTQTLIEEGLCSDRADCSRKEMALWSAGGWKIGPFVGGGVGIQVYRVSDEGTAKKIVDRARSLHAQIPDVPVTVTIYSNAHIDNLHPGTPVVVLREKIS